MISIVIPTYNRESTIGRAIKSVINQSYQNWECIIVDDGSIDNSEQVICSFNDSRIIYHKHKINKNASTARNTGMNMSRGKYIALLDSDDEWLPTKLEKQLQLLKSLPSEYGMVSCWQDYYNGKTLFNQLHKNNRGILFPQILTQILTGGAQTLFFKREVFEKVGGFDERITNGDDQDFIRRISQYYHIDLVPEVLVKVHLNHSSETRLSDKSVKKNNLDFINSLKIELEIFRNAFNKHRDLKASIYTQIAYHYALVGDWKYFFKYNSQAWLLWPWRGRIRSTIRGIKRLLKQ